VRDSEIAIYYMRDNHTFRRLPFHVEDGIQAIKDEFEEGYTHGMLCSKDSRINDLHARGMKKWFEFERQATEWIASAILVNQQPAGQE